MMLYDMCAVPCLGCGSITPYCPLGSPLSSPLEHERMGGGPRPCFYFYLYEDSKLSYTYGRLSI
jgi:hypothetical protein